MGKPRETIPIELVVTAYRESFHGLVGLVLRDVAPESLDTVLDPVVKDTISRWPSGVLYLDAKCNERILALAAGASVLVAESEEFRSTLHDNGLVSVTPRYFLATWNSGSKGAGSSGVR